MLCFTDWNEMRFYREGPALDKRYRERYPMSMLENLAFIKDQGTDAFLQKEAETWQCPGCGGIIFCHNGICFDCGIERFRARAFEKDRAIPLGRITWVKQLNGPFISAKNLSPQKLRRKKEPHIGIPVGFSGSTWAK